MPWGRQATFAWSVARPVRPDPFRNVTVGIGPLIPPTPRGAI